MGLHVLYVPQDRAPLCGQLLQLYGQVGAVGVVIILAPAVSDDVTTLWADGWFGSEGGPKSEATAVGHETHKGQELSPVSFDCVAVERYDFVDYECIQKKRILGQGRKAVDGVRYALL